jgi:hypothetical protein
MLPDYMADYMPLDYMVLVYMAVHILARIMRLHYYDK